MNLSFQSAIGRPRLRRRVISFYLRSSGSGFFLTPSGFKYQTLR